MNETLHCEIYIQGHLSKEWSDWFGGLSIEDLPDGLGQLQGPLPDYAALYGVLVRLRDLGLKLLMVRCADSESATAHAFIPTHQTPMQPEAGMGTEDIDTPLEQLSQGEDGDEGH